MEKIIVSIDHGVSDEKRAAVIKTIADALGVLADDVVFVRSGINVSVVDVPDELIAARKKKDAEEKKEAEADTKE